MRPPRRGFDVAGRFGRARPLVSERRLYPASQTTTTGAGIGRGPAWQRLHLGRRRGTRTAASPCGCGTIPSSIGSGPARSLWPSVARCPSPTAASGWPSSCASGSRPWSSSRRRREAAGFHRSGGAVRGPDRGLRRRSRARSEPTPVDPDRQEPAGFRPARRAERRRRTEVHGWRGPTTPAERICVLVRLVPVRAPCAAGAEGARRADRRAGLEGRAGRRGQVSDRAGRSVPPWPATTGAAGPASTSASPACLKPSSSMAGGAFATSSSARSLPTIGRRRSSR